METCAGVVEGGNGPLPVVTWGPVVPGGVGTAAGNCGGMFIEEGSVSPGMTSFGSDRTAR